MKEFPISMQDNENSMIEQNEKFHSSYSADSKTTVERQNFCSLVTRRYDAFDANKVTGLPYV